MKIFYFVGFLFLSCGPMNQGSVKEATPVSDEIPLKFADVEQIVLSNCARSGCHNGEDKFSLKTREDFFNRIPRPLNSIMKGRMPKNDPAFKDTAEGQKLIKWLEGPQTE